MPVVEEIVQVNLPGSPYPVVIGEGVMARLGPLLKERLNSSRALLVSDTRVYPLFGETCRRSLEQSGWRVAVKLVRPGERSKTLAGAARLYDAAVEAALDRRCPMVALGGGVVGDLAGFAAATYLRGVPLVAVPTTLLAQVDSSVGGKTAVNHPRGKNLIGSFHQPALVAADSAALRTLPLRQLRAGAAEVVKYALIGDPSFFAWLEKNLERFWQKDPSVLGEAVARSVRAKAAVVERDERERDYRRILNFGHTVGHALEAATGYRHYLHGEAVLAGMAAAVELSRRLGLLAEGEAARICRLLERVGFKAPPAGLDPEAVLEKLPLDKKREGEDIVFVLLRGVGSVVFQPVREKVLLREVIRFCLGYRQGA